MNIKSKLSNKINKTKNLILYIFAKLFEIHGIDNIGSESNIRINKLKLMLKWLKQRTLLNRLVLLVELDRRWEGVDMVVDCALFTINIERQ